MIFIAEASFDKAGALGQRIASVARVASASRFARRQPGALSLWAGPTQSVSVSIRAASTTTSYHPLPLQHFTVTTMIAQRPTTSFALPSAFHPYKPQRLLQRAIIEGPPGASGTPQRSRKRTIQPKPLKDHTKNCAYTISPEEHRNFCREQGLPMNQHQSAELRLTYISEHILSRLTEYGWAVVDNFLGTDLCWHIHKEMRVLESRGLFRAGQVANDGKYKDEHHVKDIRSDKTYWFSGTDDSSSDACTVRMLITYLDSIVHRFSRRLQGNQIQGRSRAMLAIYPGNGSRYVKHVDNPAKDGRRITVIYYCNPDWNYTEDGGVLRLYPETSATPLDIEPRGDRLIAFWSDHRVPHEVMPVHRDRLAITVWYMDRNERDKHIKKTDTKPATSAAATQETASSSQLKGAKEKRMDTTEITTNDAKAKVDDATDHDDVDSGRGNSMSNNATSFRSRTLSTDSVNLSDNDDDDHLPQADDFDPEYNI